MAIFRHLFHPEAGCQAKGRRQTGGKRGKDGLTPAGREKERKKKERKDLHPNGVELTPT